MAWHTRLFRRTRLMPGVTLNISKSGPSVSVGPRGARMTFGRRGIRQTVGVPGTGFYATRQVGPGSRAGAAARTPAAAPAVVPAGSAPEHESEPVEIAFGLVLVAAVGCGLVAAVLGAPGSTAAGVGVVALVAGLGYEWLAAHHPGAAKVLAQVVGAAITVVFGFLTAAAVVLVAILGAAVAGGALGGGRHR